MDHGQLAAYIGQLRVGQHDSIEIYFGVDQSVVGDALVVGSFPLRISNEGEKSIDGVTVSYRYHELMKRSAFESLTYQPVGTFEDAEIRRSFSEMDEFHMANYRLPHLSPGLSFGLNDPMALAETTVESEVEIEDGLILPFSVDFSLLFDVLIHARDTSQILQQVKVSVFDAKDQNELKERIERKVAPQARADFRRHFSFVEYLKLLIIERPQKDIILIHPNLEVVKEAGHKVFIGQVDHSSVTTASFRLATFDELWGM